MFLYFWENKQHQIEDGWFLYFENSTDKSASFILENYSKNTSFNWELYLDDSLIKKESVQILKNNKKNVIIDQPLEGKLVKIIVFHSKESKDIYKNIE